VVEARGRTTRTSLVVVRLLVAGESHHLLTRTGKLDGWSMVTAPLKYEEGLDWHRAAVRGAEEQLAPLRVGEDFHLVPLSDEPLSWVSKSISGSKTSHKAQVFGLRFAYAPDLTRLRPGAYRLVPDAQLAGFRDDALRAVLAVVPDPPLSWGTPPGPAEPNSAAPAIAGSPAGPGSVAVDPTPSRTPRAPRRSASSASTPPPEPGGAWTASALARLGVDTDKGIAKELGLSISAVSQRRRALGIQRSRGAALEGRTWTAAEDALLGRETDGDVGHRLGIPPAAVEQRRLRLGVAGYGVNPSSYQEPADLAGAEYDRARRAGESVAEIARRLGVDRKTVERALLRYARRIEARSGKKLGG